MNWSKFKVFYQVANVGSFTRAGEILCISQSAISRTVIELEETLGTKLFDRGCRGVALTKDGEFVYERVREMFEAVENIQQVYKNKGRSPSGQLDVAFDHILSSADIAILLFEFNQKYPKVQLSSVGYGEGGHVLVGLQRPAKRHINQIEISKLKFGLFASKEYLQERGPLTEPAQLLEHQLITLNNNEAGKAVNDWFLGLGPGGEEPCKPHIQVNSGNDLLEMARHGCGIVALPVSANLFREHKLVRVLPEVASPSFEVGCEFPEQLQNDARVRAFTDFLRDRFNEINMNELK